MKLWIWVKEFSRGFVFCTLFSLKHLSLLLNTSKTGCTLHIRNTRRLSSFYTWMNLMFIEPCIQYYFYSKTNKMHQWIKFILFWNETLRVSDGLSLHHQEFKIVHTTTVICQTDTAVCLLASRQQYLIQTSRAFTVLQDDYQQNSVSAISNHLN